MIKGFLPGWEDLSERKQGGVQLKTDEKALATALFYRGAERKHRRIGCACDLRIRACVSKRAFIKQLFRIMKSHRMMTDGASGRPTAPLIGNDVVIFITFSTFSAVAYFMIVMQSLADAFSIMIRYTLEMLSARLLECYCTVYYD